MSRVISGWVVSRNGPSAHGLHWQAWRSGETRIYAETYRGLLTMIRERNI